LPETELKVLLGEVLAGYEKSEALLNELSTRLFASASSILDAESRCEKVCRELTKLGIEKVIIDRSLARGFDYYTGIIFEIFATDQANPRSIAGGGRYDNLTALFTNETISGIGFGMGDVIMRDFLETHNLLPDNLSLSPHLTIIPLDDTVVAEALKIAQSFRERNLNKAFRVYVDYNTSKLGKKVGQASANQSTYVLVIGSNELNANHFTIKKLATGETLTGPLDELIIKVITETK